MKRYIRSSQYDLNNIPDSVYDPAIEVAESILHELHMNYPSTFPKDTTTYVGRKASFGVPSYVYIDMCSRVDNDILTIHDFETTWVRKIYDEIFPVLGISEEQFEISIEVIRKGGSFYSPMLLVFDNSYERYYQ